MAQRRRGDTPIYASLRWRRLRSLRGSARVPVMTDDRGDEPLENLLSPTALAVLLDISRRHLDDLRREDPTFPKPVMLGRLPRWRPAAIRRWLDGSAEPSDGAVIDPGPAPGAPRARRGKAVARVH